VKGRRNYYLGVGVYIYIVIYIYICVCGYMQNNFGVYIYIYTKESLQMLYKDGPETWYVPMGFQNFADYMLHNVFFRASSHPRWISMPSYI